MKLEVSADSLLVWWRMIKDLDIPKPKTEVVILTKEELKNLYCGEVHNSILGKVVSVCDKFGYPCFLRTDLASGKFDWENACYVKSRKTLIKNILGVVEFNNCADIMGLPFKAFAAREFIPMAYRYTAFYSKMPVSPERRYFVENGEVLCHHPYWIEEAIRNPSASNWKELSAEMNFEEKAEVSLLTGYAEQVSKVMKGFWSVDFCKAKDGRWILIDMALGDESWHQEKCKHNRTPIIDYHHMTEENRKFLEDKMSRRVEIEV